jgi:hypothetical protein
MFANMPFQVLQPGQRWPGVAFSELGMSFQARNRRLLREGGRMKRLAVVSLAAISFAGSVYAHPIELKARTESYAARRKMGHIVVVPLHSGRSAYIGAAPMNYRLIGPSWSALEAYR